MHLYDLTDLDEMTWLTTNGYLREQQHPTEQLAILNYTDRAMTKPEIFTDYPSINHCRGLIYNTATGAIVARPFKKFWNHGQSQAAKIKAHDPVQVVDKIDGSLGIIYPSARGGFAVATRGSFTSDQAVHGTAVLRERYADFNPEPGYTPLVEIVYPANRIVLDYGTQDDLILLGDVDIESGDVGGPEVAWRRHVWQGPAAETHLGGDWHEILSLIDLKRRNREGYVVRVVGKSPRRGNMIKLKQEDYLELHRVVFGLSTRRVYEAIVAGQTLDTILAPLPDEFHDWTRRVYGEIYGAFKKRYRGLSDLYGTTMEYARNCNIAEFDDVDGYWVADSARGALARLFHESGDDAWALFALLDGRDISKKLWKELKPEAGQTPSNYEPKVA